MPADTFRLPPTFGLLFNSLPSPPRMEQEQTEEGKEEGRASMNPPNLRSLLFNSPRCHPGQKKCPASSFEEAGQIPGNDLLSRGLSPNYHRRSSVSLPGSGWDRVVPLRSGHQKAIPSFPTELGFWRPQLGPVPLSDIHVKNSIVSSRSV